MIVILAFPKLFKPQLGCSNISTGEASPPRVTNRWLSARPRATGGATAAKEQLLNSALDISIWRTDPLRRLNQMGG
jgi:hypothetical protein